MNGISNIYSGKVYKNRALKKGAQSPRLSDCSKRYDKECGEVIVTRRVQMAPVEIPATSTESAKVIPLTSEQKVAKASFLKFFSRHLEVARKNEHPTLGKGVWINGKFVALRSNKW